MSTEKTKVEYRSFHPEHTEEEAQRFFHLLLGSPIVSWERLNEGEVNVVYSFSTQNGEAFVVKISPKSRGSDRFEVEAWAYEECRKAGIVTPEVVKVDVSCSRFPEKFLLTKRIEGTPGQQLDLSQQERLDLIRQLGGIYRQIHSIRVEGFGRHLEKRGSTFVGKERTLVLKVETELYNEYIRLNEGTPNEVYLTQAREFFQAHLEIFKKPTLASLIHHDLGPSLHNVLVEDGQIVAVLDMENVISGDPVEEFARATLWPRSDSAILQALKDGYGESEIFDGDFEAKMVFYQIIKSLRHVTYYRGREKYFGRPQKQLERVIERLLPLSEKLKEFE